jgi:hypothetical protein
MSFSHKNCYFEESEERVAGGSSNWILFTIKHTLLGRFSRMNSISLPSIDAKRRSPCLMDPIVHVVLVSRTKVNNN